MKTDTALSRRRLLGAVPALAATVGPAAATALGDVPTKPAALSSDDPIFAAIEAHRKADAEWMAKLDRKEAELEKLGSVHEKDAPSYQDCDAAMGREGETAQAMFTTMPTTLAGFIALFQRLSEPRYAANFRPGEDPELNSFIRDIQDNYWWGHDDAYPSPCEWLMRMELALRRIAATA